MRDQVLAHQVPQDDLSSLESELLSWKADEVPPSVGSLPWLAVHDGIHHVLKTYLLGLVCLRQGYCAKALEYADMLDRMDGPERAEGLKRDYASGLRAQVHREKGELVEALEQFERTTWDSAHLDCFFSPFFKMGLERFVRAEVLHEMGRHEEALGWTSSFNLGWNMLFVYRAPIHLRQAEYHESLGHTDEAIEHYSRFVDCWKDCDEGLRPLVEEARSRLEDLKPPEP